MHEEFLKEEALKAEDQQRHFAMFGSPNKSPASSGSFTKGKNSRVSPNKDDKFKSPEILPAIREKLESKENGTKVSPKTNKNNKDSEDKPDKSDSQKENGVVNSDSYKGAKSKSEKETGLKGVIESNSQTPCSSKDIDNTPILGETNSCENSEVSDPKHSVANSDLNADKNVDLDENKKAKNGAVGDSDSEDEVRHEDITVEERKARLKRTLSPSFYSEDVYRLKKQRVRNDSFMCKY